jgi:2'-5' RNA ligase
VKRLFIAVDVDEQTCEAIGRLSSALRDHMGPRLRISWVRPDRMHLTLQFFGHASEMVEQRLLAALSEPLREPPFGLSFEGLGFFPNRGSPRVVWLGVRDGFAEIRRVHHALELRLGEPGSREGAFTPHLTLARVRDRISRGEMEEIGRIQALAGPCVIDRVTLYESRLSPAGPTYVRLADAALTS